MTRTTNPGPRGTRERQDARPEHPPSLPSHTRDRRPTTPRAHTRARPAANPRHHAQRAPNTRPRERPAEHAPTPPRANHAHQPREHATKRETRSLPLFLASRPGRSNGRRGWRRRGRPRAPGTHGCAWLYVATHEGTGRGESMATHGHATTRMAGGRGSTGSCAPCELGHALASLAMRGRSCGLAAWGSGPRPGGSSARGATPATPSATGTHARA
jgi:hypothetical protein